MSDPYTPTDANDPDEHIVEVTETVEETLPPAEPDPDGLDDPEDDPDDV